MTGKQFDLLLMKSIKTYGDDYITLPESDEPHSFSPSFERKMRKLIKRQNAFYFSMVKTPVRKAVTITIAIIIILTTMVMSVSALRKVFLDFIMEIFSTHTAVEVVTDGESPDHFQDVYAITNLPPEFQLTYTNAGTEGSAWIMTIYNSASNQLILTQYLKKSYYTNINTEGYDMTPVDLNGHEGFLVDMNGYLHLTWSNADYVFVLEGVFDRNALISMANSVQKIE